MTTPEDIASLSREELLDLVAQLQRQLNELQARNQQLRSEVERLSREKKRQAAPFSRGTRAQDPKRPGRKPGEGTFSFRQAPHPKEITEPPKDVPVTLEACPSCGGKLRELRVDFAYVTELTPLPRPRVTQYRVWVCRCTGCGRQVRGEHPDLAPDQYGSTAHRVGRRAMAAAHALHYQVGIPVRKVPLVLGLLTGMKLTQGAISQDALRRAKGNVGQKVQEVVPRNYPGVMGTDRGRSYEDKSFRRVKQQKCLAHLQRTLSEVLAHKKGRARDLAERTQELLRLAARLWKEYHWGDWKEFDRWVPEVRLALSYHLRDRPLKDQDNQKLLRMLRRYHQRGDLLRFLEQPEVEPTNNRVERMLRPAVIARKVSHCSKTWPGAYALAAFTSVIQTLLKKCGSSSVVEAMSDLFHAPRSQTAPA